MTSVQAVLYSIMGFASGCLINVGFLLQMLYVIGTGKKDGLTRAAFGLLFLLTGLACGISVILVIFLVVMRDEWNWGAFMLFAFWLAVSFSGSIFSFHLVARKLNPLINQSKDVKHFKDP